MAKVVKKDNEIGKLLTAFGDDKDLLLFYLKWVECGLNASKAYKALHPDVGAHSADTLGSRMLSKVDKTMIMQAYGLDLQYYLTELKGGLEAMGIDPYTGDKYKDYRARKPYHDKLGKLLGIEQDRGVVVNQQQNNFFSINDLHEYIDQQVKDGQE